MIEINYIGVVVAAVIAMVLGFLWYGPLFSKPWMKELGLTKEKIEASKKKGMTLNYVLMMVSALVMAYVLAHVIAMSVIALGHMGLLTGVQSGFWMWLGFVATVVLGKVLWEGRSWKLYAIDAGYYLVSLILMGVAIVLVG